MGGYGCQGGQSFLVGGKGSYWSQVSHRKLKISIWVASILGDTAKDALLSSFKDISYLYIFPNLENH